MSGHAPRRVSFSPAETLALRLGVLLLGLWGCASTVSLEDRLQQMVGISEDRLDQILAQPSEVVDKGEVEYRMYRWVIQNVEMFVDRHNSSYIRRDERFQIDAVCQVAFAIREEKVTAVDCTGKTTRNGIYDTDCRKSFLTCLDGKRRTDRCPFVAIARTAL